MPPEARVACGDKDLDANVGKAQAHQAYKVPNVAGLGLVGSPVQERADVV